ncbi:MAG: hypothetical protein AB7J35_02795 [Dehalococcoidia bacterium]
MRSAATSLGLFLLVGVLFGACSDDDTDSGASTPLALYRGKPNGDDALLSGRLVLDGRCLYVEASDTSRSFVALPEVAAKWDSEAGTLVMGDRSAKPGDQVGFGGGFPGTLEHMDWETAPDEACDTSRAFIAGETLYTAEHPPGS